MTNSASANVSLDRRYRGLSLTERRAQRREALIRGAIEVYGERGYRHATVKAICEAAGLTERYFYESFSNGEALLIASFQTVTQQTLAEMELAAAGEDAPPADRLLIMLRAYFSILKERPRGARVFLVEVASLSVELDQMLSWAVSAFSALFERTLEVDPAPMKEGRQLLRAGVAGGVFQIALNWMGRGYAENVEVVAAQALRLCLLLNERASEGG